MKIKDPVSLSVKVFNEDCRRSGGGGAIYSERPSPCVLQLGAQMLENQKCWLPDHHVYGFFLQGGSCNRWEKYIIKSGSYNGEIQVSKRETKLGVSDSIKS